MQKRRVLTIARSRRPTVHASDGTFGSGSARLGLSQKGGLPFRCLARHLIAAQGHRRAHPLRRGSYERATSSCFSTMEDRFGKRPLTFIEGEMGGPVTAATIAKRIPSLSMADIQKAMKYLEAQRRLARS